jgi:hypothetical protein
MAVMARSNLIELPIDAEQHGAVRLDPLGTTKARTLESLCQGSIFLRHANRLHDSQRQARR